MKFLSRILKISAILLGAVLFSNCTREIVNDSDYGYLQFRLYKSASYQTKAPGSLEYLRDAAKVRIRLLTKDADIVSPTVTVTAIDKSISEFGVQTEKFKLLAGEYEVLDYQIYDLLDNPTILVTPETKIVVSVVADGLTCQDLTVNVVERGWVNFRLTKDMSELLTKAGEGAQSHPFFNISSVDVKVRNKNTKEEFLFENIATEFEAEEVNDNGNYTSYCTSDSLVLIKGGEYEVTWFRTYFDRSRRVYETCSAPKTNSFTVKDNEETRADVPVTLHATSGYIQDAITLKKIWDALDGPNWSVKWNFDCDVDLWLANEGVQILENGRVAALYLEGFGAKGDMPACLGDLVELRQLYLGSHSFDLANSTVTPSGKTLANLYFTDRDAFRKSFHNTFVENQDPKSRIFAPEMGIAFTENNARMKSSTGTDLLSLPTGDPTNYSNYITSLPAEINNLKKLEALYIGYCAMTDFPEDMSNMTALTDIEIFGNPDLETFPIGFSTLPSIQVITFSYNSKVSSEKMYEGLKALNEGAASQSLQILYIPGQQMEVCPDLTAIKYLSMLNVQSCGITRFETAFGLDHPFASFYAQNNNLTELPRDSKGFFIGMDSETESINFSGNKFTQMPDMFSAKSSYSMGTIDFSDNQIESFEALNGKWRGVNCETFNLGRNKLTKFPREIAESNSSISYISLSGNGMEKVEPEALKSENMYKVTTFDLSYNKLTELPDEFNRYTFPALYGLDLSYNRFNAFPYYAVDNPNITVFIFRHQRDENGNRCMKEWPTGIGQYLYKLRGLYLGSNDIRKVDDTLSYLIYNLDISDNPNISIDVSSVCSYIGAGYFNLFYSKGQDIRGCDTYLNLL